MVQKCVRVVLLSKEVGKKADVEHVHIVAKQLVKGCLTLVMNPTSLLQQSLVPHIVMVH